MAYFMLIAAALVDAVHLAIIMAASMISYLYICYRARGYYKKPLVYTAGMIAVSATINFAVGRCPLTMASEWLRQQADPTFSMSHGFIPYYLNDVMGMHLPLGLTLVVVYFMMIVPPILTFLTLGYGRIHGREAPCSERQA